MATRAIRQLKDLWAKMTGEQIDITDKNFYNTRIVALDSARVNEEYAVMGDFIYCETATGTLDLRINTLQAPVIRITTTRRIYTPFEKIYLTNTAQAGKTVTLFFGGDASFEAEPSTGSKVGLVDSSGTDINPSKEDGNLATILTHIGNIYAYMFRRNATNSATLINNSAAGSVTLANTAPTNSYNRLVKMVLSFEGGTNSFQLWGGTSSMSSTMAFNTGSVMTYDGDIHPLDSKMAISLIAGNTLSINFQNANKVTGWIQYKQEVVL